MYFHDATAPRGRRRRPNSGARGALAALLAGLALAGAVPAAAEAEPSGVSRQAAAIEAGFLLAAPAPAQTVGICLVDTGVTPNPDTSAVSVRLGLGGDPDDQSPTLHGTTMAMYMAAPINGWGMVGIWPGARIVSVAAALPAQDAFAAAGYINGIKQCDKIAGQYGLGVIELALSSATPPSGEDAAQLADVVATARAHGLDIVAAAGNAAGGPVGTPADIPGVISVAAVDSAGGAPCAFASSGALLSAPGCGLDGADPSTGAEDLGEQGESEAAAIAAAALAALRSYRPELTAAAAEEVLEDTATPISGGRLLNLSAAFSSQGLGALTVGVARTPEPVGPVLPDLTPRRPGRLPRPRVVVVTRGHGASRTLTIRVRNRPAGVVTRVIVYARRGANGIARVAGAARRSSTLALTVRTWTRLGVRFTDPHHRHRASVTTTVHPTRTVRARR